MDSLMGSKIFASVVSNAQQGQSSRKVRISAQLAVTVLELMSFHAPLDTAALTMDSTSLMFVNPAPTRTKRVAIRALSARWGTIARRTTSSTPFCANPDTRATKLGLCSQASVAHVVTFALKGVRRVILTCAVWRTSSTPAVLHEVRPFVPTLRTLSTTLRKVEARFFHFVSEELITANGAWIIPCAKLIPPSSSLRNLAAEHSRGQRCNALRVDASQRRGAANMRTTRRLGTCAETKWIACKACAPRHLSARQGSTACRVLLRRKLH